MWQCTCIDGAGATVAPLTGPQELPTVSIIDTGHRLVVGHFHFFIIWAHSQRIFEQKNEEKIQNIFCTDVYAIIMAKIKSTEN